MADAGAAAGLVAVLLASGLLVLTVVRIGLATSHRRRLPDRGPVPVSGVTVLQAIRSGDPLLLGMLQENRRTSPDAHLVWLVDEDDPAGVAAARAAAEGPGARVSVVVAPVLAAGRNPKVAKLVVGLPLCGEVVAVLDDDTVLPPGALGRAVAHLADGDLVTGVPVYREQGSVWSRLLAAFVNASSLLSYPAMARVAPPVSINGMFWVTRRTVLDEVGGLAAIEALLCDDYELARLYRGAGRTIVQSFVIHPLATTVPDARTYRATMRRWLLFASQVLRRDLTPALVGLVVLPSVLPLASLVLAVAASIGRGPAAGWSLAVVVTVLALDATLVAVWRANLSATPLTLRGVALEALVRLLVPVHAVAAAVGPSAVPWRDRPATALPPATATPAPTTPDDA